MVDPRSRNYCCTRPLIAHMTTSNFRSPLFQDLDHCWNARPVLFWERKQACYALLSLKPPIFASPSPLPLPRFLPSDRVPLLTKSSQDKTRQGQPWLGLPVRWRSFSSSPLLLFSSSNPSSVFLSFVLELIYLWMIHLLAKSSIYY